jgi:hypothetical protein
MPNILNASGLQTAPLSEVVNNYTTDFQDIYGASINLESDTPDGQIINIFAQSVVDVEDLITNVYNSFDPDQAIGTTLDQRVAINGIQRQVGTYTTTYVTVVTSQSVNLYGLDQSANSVFTVADGAGNQYQLITSQYGVASGTNSFLFQASTPGQVLTTPNTITTPVTVVLGVTSVNNPTAYATLGINEETDAALKIRRQKSVSIPAQGYYQGLLAALENIPGIGSAIVYENFTSSTNSYGIPGHSIWVVVNGTPTNAPGLAYNSATTYSYGNIASSGSTNYISVANSNLGNSLSNTSYWLVYNPIAWTIYNYRNAGCGMYGSLNYNITQIDGSFLTIFWSTVVPENLFIKFTAYSLNGINPPNIAGIQNYLTNNLIPGVNQEVSINQIQAYAIAEDPNSLVLNAGLSSSATGTFSNTLVPASANYQFAVSNVNTIVLPVLLSSPNSNFVFASASGGYYVSSSNTSIAHGGKTIQFQALGGYGTYSYAVTGTGTISSAGLYTSPSGAYTDYVQVQDSLSNLSQLCTVSVT